MIAADCNAKQLLGIRVWEQTGHNSNITGAQAHKHRQVLVFTFSRAPNQKHYVTRAIHVSVLAACARRIRA